MKKIIQRTAAVFLGLMLGAVAWAGLETVTHISDLNSSWPLGSDLASTSDDHIRNIKVALKTDFPNVNAAVTPTPTQFNQLTNNTFSTNRMIVNAPSSGDTITATALATNYALTLNGSSGNPVYMRLIDGKTGTRSWWTAVGDAGTGIWSLHDATRGADILTANTTGDLTITAPSSGTALTVNGLNNSDTLLVQSGTTSAQGFGLRVQAGTTSADYSFLVQNAANNVTYLQVKGNGQILGGGPVAATTVDMTPDKSTFTGTLTGMTAGTTGTVSWSRMGNIVVVYIASAISGTSNATTMTMTGLPSAIQPATTQIGTCPVTDAANGTVIGSFSITTGTITFGRATVNANVVQTGTAFQNSGTKGLPAGWMITYAVN